MRRLIAMMLALCLLLAGGTTPALGATIEVDCRTGADLQAAVDAASPGDTLAISGTCRGGVVIDKDLTLSGALEEPTIVPAELQGDRSLLRVRDGAGVVVRRLAFRAALAREPILNEGRLTMRDVLIAGNDGDPSGSIITNRGRLRLIRAVVRGNLPRGGGAILNEGDLVMRHSTIEGNGGSEVNWGGLRNTASGTALLVETTIADNDGRYRAGGLVNAGTMTLVDSLVERNRATELSRTAGGIENLGHLTLVGTVVRNNTGNGRGGGIENRGTLILEGSVVRANAISEDSPWCDEPGVACSGGGIHNARGRLRLVDSVVGANTALLDGGGLHNARGRVWLVRSNVRNNDAERDGGGIHNAAAGRLDLREVTVLANEAGRDGGGIANDGIMRRIDVRFRFNSPDNCTGC